MLCSNVFGGSRDIVAHDATSWAVSQCCTDISKFSAYTPDTITAVLARLDEGHRTMTSQNFQELQTRLGGNREPHGLLADASMRPLVDPTARVLYDWHHVFFVHGVFNHHAGRMLRELHVRHGMKMVSLQEHISF